MDEKKNLLNENKEKLSCLLNKAEVREVVKYTDEELVQKSHEELENLVRNRTAQLLNLKERFDECSDVMDALNEAIDEGIEKGNQTSATLKAVQSDLNYYKGKADKERNKVETLKKMIQTWEF